jgi:periplasmic protein TonB
MRLCAAILAASLVICGCATTPVALDPWVDFTATLDREEELFRQQWQLLDEKKHQVGRMEPGPRRDELLRLLSEIESRMRSQPHVLYIPPASNLTPEMAAYYTRMMRRLEDCGTRNFPSRGGASVHGGGSISISIDSSGNLVKSEILKSSGIAQVDLHMINVARATSPFGPVPEKPIRSAIRPYTEIVMLTNFDFGHSADSSEPLPTSEQCKWP